MNITHPTGVLQHSGFEQHTSPPSEAHGPLGRRESVGRAPHTDVKAVDRHTLLRPQTQQLEEVQLDTPHIYLQLPIRCQRITRTNHRSVLPSLVLHSTFPYTPFLQDGSIISVIAAFTGFSTFHDLLTFNVETVYKVCEVQNTFATMAIKCIGLHPVYRNS